MSGLVKGVKKVFKGIGKVVKKIAPFALPIAAAVATVGGFAGVPFFAGGFGGTVSRIFGNGVLGKAITYAGYSGMAGAAIGGVTGGMKGAVRGSLIGQAVGGAAGAISGMMAPAAGATGATGASQASTAGMPAGGAAPGAQGLGQSTAVMRGYGAELPGQVAGPMSGAMPAGGAAPGIGAAATQTAQGVTNAAYALPSSQAAAAGLSSAAGGMDPAYWSNMKQIAMIGAAGAAAPGIGQALGGLFSSKEDSNQQLAVEEARAKRIRENYANPPAVSFPTVSRRPVERYAYNPATGMVEKGWA